MRTYFITIAILFILFGWGFGHVQAYSLSEPQSSDITNGVNGLVNGVLKGFAPGGSKDIVNNAKGLTAPKVASSSFSTTDLITPFKAILTLIINLFFVVIQVVVDILKALLSVVSNYKP